MRMSEQSFLWTKDSWLMVAVGLLTATAVLILQTSVLSERAALMVVLLGTVFFLAVSIRYPITLVFAIILYESLLSWRQAEQIQILGYNRLLFYAVFVGVFGLAIIYRFFVLERRLKICWIDIALLLLIGAYGITAVFAVDRAVARPGFTYFLATALTFYTVRLVVLNKKDVYQIIGFLLGFMFFEAALGVAQRITGTGLLYVSSVSGGDVFPRATGTLGNGLGWYLTIGYIFAFNLWLYNRKTKQSWVYFIVLSVIVLGLVVANTRGAWVDCVLATLISLVPFVKVQKTKLLLIISAVIMGTAVVLTSSTAWNRIISIWEQISNPGQSTIGFRFYIWQAALKMFQQNPLFGVGPDNFRPQLANYIAPESQSFIRISAERSFNTHHAGLQLLSETGLFGFITFTLFITAFVYLAWRLHQRLKHQDRPLAMALLIFSIMSTLSILYGGYSYGGYTQVGSLYFLIAGLTTTLITITPSHNRNRMRRPVST